MKKSVLMSAVLAAALASTQVVAQSSFPDGTVGVGIEGTEEGTTRVTSDDTTTDTTSSKPKRGKGNGKGKGSKK